MKHHTKPLLPTYWVHNLICHYAKYLPCWQYTPKEAILAQTTDAFTTNMQHYCLTFLFNEKTRQLNCHYLVTYYSTLGNTFSICLHILCDWC